jgi:hypothetical protein
MGKHQGKFLVEWLNSFTHPQLFFMFWAVLAGIFVYLYLRQQARLDERQFKPGGQKTNKSGSGKGIVSVEKKGSGLVTRAKD